MSDTPTTDAICARTDIVQYVPADYARKLEQAVRAMIAEPYGCAFCDSGKLRDSEKGHEDDCAWKLAEECGQLTHFKHATSLPEKISAEDFR